MNLSHDLRPGDDPVAFFRSPLNFWLTVAGLVLLSIAVNGYMAYRSDHLSQIPLIFIQRDPGLYPADWFFQNFGHFKLRFMHLTLIKSLAWAVGIPGALVAWYVLCIGSVIAAWLAIGRHLFGSLLPGVVAAVMGIVFYGEVGANHLIERILIPRTEAFAIIYWGVFCLITGRAVVAGLLFGAASTFQPAVGVQFAIPMLLWLAAAGGPGRWKQILKFLGCFALVLTPWMLFLGESFAGTSRLTDEEIIHVVAWLRHPPLMLPRFFGRSVWADFLLLLAASGLAWRWMGRDNLRVRRAGWLIPIMAALLFVATVFIEFVPVKEVILFQPFRASVLLYLMMYLMLGPYMLGLLRSEDPWRRFRGVLLLGSIYVLKLFGVLMMVEMVLAWRDRQGKGRPKSEAALLAAMTLVGGFLIEVEVGGRTTTWFILVVAVAVTLLLEAGRRTGAFGRPERLRRALIALCLAGFLSIGSVFAMPWERWLESENAATRVRAARFIWRYQLVPAPVMALERIGLWAADHTPREALFLTPPEKNVEGFQLWSKRSIVFNVKYFPVTQAAYEEWRNRYLAHCGILDPADPAMAEALQDAMTDYGTKRIAAKYAALDEATILALAEKYGAGYVITPTRYGSERLRLLVSDYDRLAGGPEGHELHLFEIVGE